MVSPQYQVYPYWAVTPSLITLLVPSKFQSIRVSPCNYPVRPLPTTQLLSASTCNKSACHLPTTLQPFPITPCGSRPVSTGRLENEQLALNSIPRYVSPHTKHNYIPHCSRTLTVQLLVRCRVPYSICLYNRNTCTFCTCRRVIRLPKWLCVFYDTTRQPINQDKDITGFIKINVKPSNYVYDALYIYSTHIMYCRCVIYFY